ncbi:hypothetical protein BGZ54_005015 [Gamsiella multidivaricata]|nr:hypothetical protein BGZ54_005015 [Gamsiella multidivaricata]
MVPFSLRISNDQLISRSNLTQESSATIPASPGPPKIPPKKPTKRIRISTACVNCRQKKIKCDGQVPCAHCEKCHTECVYPVATKPANQEYVETLENRLKSVESHLQGLLSRGWGKSAGPMALDGDHGDLMPDDGDIHSPYTPSSIPATPPSKPSHNSNDPHRQTNGHFITRQPSGAIMNTPNLTGPDSDLEDNTFATDDSMQLLGLLMGSLKIERDGSAQYIPRILDQKERSYNDSRIYGSSVSNNFPDLSTLDWDSAEPPFPYTLPNTLLTPKAISALMDIYFNSVHTFLPVIHKTSFLTLCQEGEYRVPPFLLMAICAVAACHATDFELQEIPELANVKSRHALYDHARSLLDTFMDVPRLSTVQGLLLLAYYQTKEKRSGHFFRIRMYVNLAVRMALDMELQRALLRSPNGVESSNTGDSLSSVDSTHGRPMSAISSTAQFPSLLNARQNAAQPGFHSRDKIQNSRLSQQKRAVIDQEKRLAWLGCFFLDGLTSSLMGQDYCIANATLDMRRLIQEASQMTDTVQGATLIFWYHHLELVQIYRRICVFYRTVQSERVLARAIKSQEMQAIESSMTEWLSDLPAHLVYVDSQGTGAALPSYYTLYLHRFYYSHKLLLYRPLISNKTHRGDPKNSNSAMASCSHAATMLTQIGEIIFQNYSWPWPGCGLFAYHMLQAAEIHVFQMITQSAVDSQSLYYRTMDLIKGYVSLAKLPDLEKDIVAMEEMVNNFLLTPQGAVAQPNASSQQQQQQHFVATPASEYSYASMMSPASPAESVQRMSMPHSNHGSHTEDADMFSPLQAHAYPSFETASRAFRQPQNGSGIPSASSAAAASGFMANSMSDTGGFSMNFGFTNVSSATSNQSQPTNSAALYDPSSSLPFYSAATPSGPSMSMFASNHHGNGLPYGQSSFLQPTLTPVGDLLGLGNMATTPSSNPLQQQQSSSAAPANIPMDTKKKPAVAPPKPPKRIFSQSTGSSSSSGISQSLKPPVPKKPARLNEITPPRWIAPRPDTTAASAAVTLMPSTSEPGMYFGGKPSAGGNTENNNIGNGGHENPSSAYPPGSNGGGPNGSIPTIGSNGRQIKVLQPQNALYGMGTLVNSLGIEQQVHPAPDPQDHVSVTSERRYYDGHEQALNYLQIMSFATE